MSDITNNIVIKVVADTSGVDAGLRPATEAARRTALAFSQMGSEALAAASNVETAARGVVASVGRVSSAMRSGRQPPGAYFASQSGAGAGPGSGAGAGAPQGAAAPAASASGGGGLRSAGAALRGGVAGLLADVSLVDTGKQLVAVQREFDRLNTAMMASTGSADQTRRVFASLRGLVATTPYGLKEVTASFLEMKNAGLDPTEEALRSYGDTATAMGKTFGQFTAAVSAAISGDFAGLEEFGVTASEQGEQVALTFKGVTKIIGKNAGEIEQYLQDLGKVNFSGSMARHMETLDGALSRLGNSWETFLLNVSDSGVGDGIASVANGLSDGLAFVSENIDAVAAGLVTAAEVAGAYFLAFMAGPAVFQAVATGIGQLQVQLALLRMNLASGTSLSSLFGASLGGVSLSAQAATGALGKLKIASGVLFAAFAGWEIGTYLYENFAQARVAGAMFVGAMLTGWEHIKYGATMSWEMIRFAWDKAIGGMRNGFADLLSGVSRGLSLLGADGPARQLSEYAAGLRAAAGDQQSFAERTAGITAAHKAATEQIKRTIDEMVAYELAPKPAPGEAKAGKKPQTSSPKSPHRSAAAGREDEAGMDGESIGSSSRVERGSSGIDAGLYESASNFLSGEQSGKMLQAVDPTNSEEIKKAREELGKFLGSLDATRAQNFGKALQGAFGAAGESMNKVIGVLGTYGERQANLDKARKNAAASYGADSKEYAAAMEAINKEEVKGRMNAYGDMASAAKGFFSEGSKGYAVLGAAERAFRTAEMVLGMESMAKKIGFKQSEVAAEGALNATKLTGEAAASAASTGIAATEASAWGVTAVVKAIASMPFPMNLAAGAATLAAIVSIGGDLVDSLGGAGGVPLSQQRQQSQGTGSVFGDSSAKSESILNALESVKDHTYQGLTISQGMLTALTDIRNSIGSFAALVVRDGRITGATLKLEGIDGKDSNFFSKLGSSIFGGKKTVEDTGFLLARATYADILNGRTDAASYADIKKSGGWFSSDKRSTQLEGLGLEGNRQIGRVITALGASIVAAGDVFGLSGEAFTGKLNSFVIDLGKISFKDMKPDEIEKELQAVFSKLGDDMARFAIGGLEGLQQVGEGYLETLTRIAQNYQAVDVVLESMGKTFGAVGLQSVAAREHLIGLFDGLDGFASMSEAFLNGFYTDEERADALRKRIAPTLQQFGIETGTEKSMESFRDVVMGLDLSTEAGARIYATLMQIAPAFKEIADVDAGKLEERAGLQEELDQLTLSETELLARQREALDESNRALFDQVQAIHAKTAADEEASRQADEDKRDAEEARRKAEEVASALLGNVESAFSVLQGVVNREKALLQERIDAEQKLIDKHQALSDALHGALEGMVLPGRDREDRNEAQAQIQAALAIARSGGILPELDSLQGALSVLSRDSSGLFATEQDYLRDFYATRLGIEDLADLTDETLSAEMQGLRLLEEQVVQYDDMLKRAQEQIDVLKGISTTGLSIEQALQALNGALAAASANPIASATSKISDAYQSMLGRAPDAGGLAYWQNVAAGGTSYDTIVDAIKNSPEAQIQKLYHDVFDRTADAGGLSFWIDRFNDGLSFDAIRRAFIESDEAKTTLNSFAVGTNYVPADMPAMIHQGERVIPAADNRELLRRVATPDDSSALAAAVERLTATVERQERTTSGLEAALEQTQRNTRRMADGLEVVTDGYNAIRMRQEVSA